MAGFLRTVYGIENPSQYIEFEDKVALDHASFIDGHIDKTKTMIGQKGRSKDLNKEIKQSDDSFLTPYQQALRYSASVKYSIRDARDGLLPQTLLNIFTTPYLRHGTIKFRLPLKTYTNVVEGGTLKIDWALIVSSMRLDLYYGDPPFIGYGNQTAEQKAILRQVYVDDQGKSLNNLGKIGYVAGWYYKVAQFIKDSTTCVAFVFTNSITQGDQVISALMM